LFKRDKGYPTDTPAVRLQPAVDGGVLRSCPRGQLLAVAVQPAAGRAHTTAVFQYLSLSMDPLSDLLRVVRLDGAFFYGVEAFEPWTVEVAHATEMTPRILPGMEHLVPYHMVTEGRCYAGLAGEETIELVAGDVIVFPHGDPHVMTSAPNVRRGPEVHTFAPARYPETVILGSGGKPTTRFACGYLGCDLRPFNPLLSALPRQMHIRGLSSVWVATFATQLTQESGLRRPGGDTVLTRLAELMFIEVLRRYLADLPQGQTGWLAGLGDEVVGRVLTLLHAQPSRAWTLPELAKEAGSSRSDVSRRFTELVGESPMQYLTQWRMQVAANLLAQSGAKVAAIASEVGYESEAAFSRAFKKATGIAPGAWREARRTPTR
jgi:AraC-like DNA-binding protein